MNATAGAVVRRSRAVWQWTSRVGGGVARAVGRGRFSTPSLLGDRPTDPR
jgi:hypothetical protein